MKERVVGFEHNLFQVTPSNKSGYHSKLKIPERACLFKRLVLCHISSAVAERRRANEARSLELCSSCERL